MSFLASILPGFRDFRSPFTAGALWLVALALILFPYRQGISAKLAEELASSASAIPQIMVLGALAFMAYILGIVITALTQRFLNLNTARISDLLPNRGMSRILQLLAIFNTESFRARELLGQHIRSRIGRLSQRIGRLVVVELVENDSELTAFRLSKEAPEQFQQYDKTLAEAEFRRAVALPILVASYAATEFLSTYWKIAVVLAGTTTFVVLLARSAREFRRSSELLATAVYLGYASPPFLDNLEKRIEEVAEPDSYSGIAWFLGYLITEDMLEFLYPVVTQLRSLGWTRPVVEALGHIRDPNIRRDIRETLENSDDYISELFVRRAATARTQFTP